MPQVQKTAKVKPLVTVSEKRFIEFVEDFKIELVEKKILKSYRKISTRQIPKVLNKIMNDSDLRSLVEGYIDSKSITETNKFQNVFVPVSTLSDNDMTYFYSTASGRPRSIPSWEQRIMDKGFLLQQQLKPWYVLSAV
jgi:hypothetical protein